MDLNLENLFFLLWHLKICSISPSTFLTSSNLWYHLLKWRKYIDISRALPGIFSSSKATLLLCPTSGVLQSMVAQGWSDAVIHQRGSPAPWWITVLHHQPEGWQERKCFKQTSFINCFSPNERKGLKGYGWVGKLTIPFSCILNYIHERAGTKFSWFTR